MPYIQSGVSQSLTGNPGIVDVYHSGNVYINNVPVALWLTPGASETFVGLDISSVPSLDAGAVAVAEANVTAYVENPNAYYNPLSANDGVKKNYIGTQEDGSTSTSTISVANQFSDIIPCLDKILDEANRGMWRESGQGGKPSNQNILSIWSNLGYTSSSPWTTDQTAWCMGFVNYVLKNSGYRYVQTASAAELPNNPSRWGATQIPKNQAQPGDIAFWSYRHVNFVYSASGGKYTFVGGNQSPKASNNPNDGDVTESYPNGCLPTQSTWVSCWRPSKT